MPKAKLSQIAATWVDEEHNTKKKELTQKEHNSKRRVGRPPENRVKKKQTFNLKAETLQRLWWQRVRSGKTISKVVDELVEEHLPKVKEI